MSSLPTILVIVPTYNENKTIVALIAAIHQALFRYQHEIVLIDDNSPDRTYATVVQHHFSYVRAFLRVADPGLAVSIRFGIERSNDDIIVVMDSDFDHNPALLPRMIEALSECDCVVASRFLRGGDMRDRLRRFASNIFNRLFCFLTGAHLSDHLYGFFALKRDVLKHCDFDAIFWGFGDYTLRLFYSLQKQHIRIIEIPACDNGAKNNAPFRLLIIFGKYCLSMIRLCFLGRIRHAVSSNYAMPHLWKQGTRANFIPWHTGIDWFISPDKI